MNEKEAKELLLHHSFQHEKFDDPKSTNGFLGCLRPFQGELNPGNYDEIIEVIRFLSDYFRESESLDKDIISSLWSICHLTRMWALDSDGMLQSNGLLTEEQISMLEVWVNNISYATMMLISGADNETAFEF